jgi:hypothetical protein
MISEYASIISFGLGALFGAYIAIGIAIISIQRYDDES